MNLLVGIPTFSRSAALRKRIEEIGRVRDVVSGVVVFDNSLADDAWARSVADSRPG